MSTFIEDGVLRLQQFIIPENPPTPKISVKASNEPLKQTLKQTIVNSNASIPSVRVLNKAFEEENDNLKRQILVISSSNANFTKRITELEAYIADLEDKREKENSYLQDQIQRVQEKRSTLEGENVELKKKLSERERESLSSKKVFEDKKALELKCSKLSKQISDFEKVLILEREKIENEKTIFETERISFETENSELSKKISELEIVLEKERKDFVKKRDIFENEKKCFQKKNMEIFKEISKNNFEEERNIFKAEILKLTRRLSALATEVMKEQKIKSDLQKAFDMTVQERNVLSDKVQQLEAIKIKVKSSEQFSADTIVQSPYDGSTDSDCSSKIASGSVHEHSSVFSTKPVKSRDQMRPSNLLYNRDATSSNTPIFKPVKMEWKVKGSTPKKDVPKSFVPPPTVNKKNNAPKGKSYAKPNPILSANHLIRLAHKKICCSFCGSNDFVHKDYTSYWYGTYSIPSKKSTPNTLGPKSRWVPKSA